MPLNVQYIRTVKKLEDTERVVRRRKSRKNKYDNDKKANDDLQNTTQKTKD